MATAGWSSEIPELIAALDAAVDDGLVAAGAVVADAVRDALRSGYTTGNFVTGANLNSVITLAPTTDGAVRVLRVTTRLTDPPYPWYWEVGHFNLFAGAGSGGAVGSHIATQRTGRFVRVEKWRPAAEQSADAAAAAFATTASASFTARLGALA